MVVAVVLGDNNGTGVSSRSSDVRRATSDVKRREWCQETVSDAEAESKEKERHTRIINTGMLQPIKYLQRHFPPTP